MTIHADLDPAMTAEMQEEYVDLLDFGKNIDFTPLFDKIKEKLDHYGIEFDNSTFYKSNPDGKYSTTVR